MFCRGVSIAYCPNFDDLPRTLQEVRPTLFIGVPRVYEKIHNQVLLKMKGAKRKIFDWALSVGRKYREQVLNDEIPGALSWKLANKLVFSKIREGVGGRARLFISGGAPLGREMAAWYADIGIRIDEGYGLTETSPVIAVNVPSHHRLGTVGKVLDNLEVRIATDGEVLVRGPSVFKGYWNMPEETAAAFEDDWFKTGDIGQLDDDGYLSITDRKKDLIKTSGGKFIAPQPIENSFKANVFVGEAAVMGDKRKFAVSADRPQFSGAGRVGEDARYFLQHAKGTGAGPAGAGAVPRNRGRAEQQSGAIREAEEIPAAAGRTEHCGWNAYPQHEAAETAPGAALTTTD